MNNFAQAQGGAFVHRGFRVVGYYRWLANHRMAGVALEPRWRWGYRDTGQVRALQLGALTLILVDISRMPKVTS